MPLLVASYIDRVSYTRLSSSARPLDRLHQHTPGWIRRELTRLKKRVSSKTLSTTDENVVHRKKHQVQPKKVDFRIWLMNIVFVLRTPLGLTFCPNHHIWDTFLNRRCIFFCQNIQLFFSQWFNDSAIKSGRNVSQLMAVDTKFNLCTFFFLPNLIVK